MQPLFLGGHPAVDFLNTSLAPDGEPIEVLIDGRSYLGWFVAAELLTEAQAASVARRIGVKALDAAAAEARMVREWLREWLVRWRAHPRANYAAELATLNRLLERDCRTFEVVAEKGEIRIVDSRHPESANELLGLVALQVAELLASERSELLKSCAGTACTLWFLDATKSHRRLYCSSSVCGNRAKVAAFRERQRN